MSISPTDDPTGTLASEAPIGEPHEDDYRDLGEVEGLDDARASMWLDENDTDYEADWPF